MKIYQRGLIAIVAIPGLVAMTLAGGAGSASVSAFDRNRELRVTKNCVEYTGTAGSFCTITSSNVPEIRVGSKVFYAQAAGIPVGLLDSNIVLDAGRGNRALGRCTLDFAALTGLCTFSDGTGRLARFDARMDVSYLGGHDWAWTGTYRFGRKDSD